MTVPDDDKALKKDLTAVIALHGLPCGEVVAVKVLAENDYAALCKDGNKYHVYQSRGTATQPIGLLVAGNRRWRVSSS